MTLRNRCREFLSKQTNRAIMRVGDPVQELMEFVIAEQGIKAGDGALDEALPLCLYFETDAEREDFVAMVKQINPNMRTRKVN